ncbi:DUF504 domain-containing protein [Kaarinaea lacus]
MKPVQEILNRIRWDEDFANHHFTIAYYDRLEKNLITVDFNDLQFSPDDHFCFYCVDRFGEIHSIPYHRVKEIYSDGILIWHREH